MTDDAPHEHYWAHARVRDARGEIHSGQRCACGIETIGDGILGGVNAEVIRAAQRLNDALAAGFTDLAKRLEQARRRRFEP